MSMINRQKLIEELMECSMVGIGKRNPKGSKEEMLYEDYIKLDTVLELIESQPPAECVPLSEVYRVIAGHSDYHGDNILAALTCIAAGKEVKPVRPLPSADQWIPCSERLPEERQKVLVTLETFTGMRFVRMDWIVDGNWWLWNSDNVTAWMPLPEPYKGE